MATDAALLDKPSSGSNRFVFVAFIFPALAGFLFGFDIGAASGAVSSVKAVHGLSTIESSLLTSASLIGATVGSILVFWLGDPLGRRREMLVGGSLYLVGTAVAVASRLYALVLVGRVLYGLGIAFSMHSAPVYISEMAPSKIRGLLVSLKEGFIVGGIMVGFGMSALFEAALDAEGSRFRAIWAVPGPIALIILGGMAAMPASPRWLMLRATRRAASAPCLGESGSYGSFAAGGAYAGERAGALAALRRFRSGSSEAEVEAELSEIEVALREAGEEGGWRELCASRKALVAGLGLIFLQQLTGQPSVLYYQEAIFRSAGFGSFAASASVIVAAAKLVATLFTVSVVDRLGRRPLLFAGISMMLAALAALSAAFMAASVDDAGAVSLPGAWSPLVVGALVVYVSGYQVGFGPISWLLISEVFPLATRGKAISCAVTLNFGSNLLVTFTLQLLQDAFDALSPGKGQALLFVLYAALCVASIVFTYFCVPETKGKTLEEIEALLK